MADTLKINNSTISLVTGDYTLLETDSIVFYARNDLKLGSGFGNAIAVRGGPSIQSELDEIGNAETTEVVVTGAGELKTNYILHAVGPKFQEPDIDNKLVTTIKKCLETAEEKGMKTITFPPMGSGFYGVPLDVSAELTLGTIKDYLSGDSKIEEVTICVLDKRDYTPYQKKLASLQ